jgi:hypothetical protein
VGGAAFFTLPYGSAPTYLNKALSICEPIYLRFVCLDNTLEMMLFPAQRVRKPKTLDCITQIWTPASVPTE